MSAAFVPVPREPFEGALDLKLDVLRGVGPGSEGEFPDRLGSHLHHSRIIGRQQVTQVVGEPADPRPGAGVPNVNADQTHWR